MKSAEIEFSNKETIRQDQNNRLQESLHYIAAHSPYYKKVWNELNISIDSIKTVDDLARLPFTTKDDIQNDNTAFICVTPAQIIDYVSTSGTLGDPVYIPMTDSDLERLAYNEAISFQCTGSDENELFQLTATADRRFMAGIAYYLGARKLGSGIIRVGSGIPEMQWDTIQKLKPSAIIGVPSFLLKMIEYAEKNGIDYKSTSVRKAICIGEPIRLTDFSWNSLGKRITDKWNIQLYSTYASTEMATAFTECSAGKGGHHHPELIVAEFIDEQGKPVPAGTPGELVITTLGVEGMPLVRFRTGDICTYHDEQCSCGRHTLRIGPIEGRKQHMIKYKGTTLYPPALYDILDHLPAVKNYIVEVYLNDIGTDEIRITIVSPEAGEKLEKEIKDHFRAKLRVAPGIVFTDMATLMAKQMPETSRKPIKFFDLR